MIESMMQSKKYKRLEKLDKDTILRDAKEEVEDLLEMFERWSKLNDKASEIEDEVFSEAVKIATEKKVDISQVTEGGVKSEKIGGLKKEKKELEEEKKSVGRNMKFKNPVVWIMYKRKAYIGTNDEMRDMKDFREHCEVPDGICTARYIFIKEYCESNLDWNIDKNEDFESGMDLGGLWEDDRIVSLVQNDDFMEEWRRHEFNMENGRPAKWAEFDSNSELIN